MLNPEFSPRQDSEDEGFYNLLGFDESEVSRIGHYFNLRLIKGFWKMSSGEWDQDVLTILPSLDINPDIGLVDDQTGNMIVALSKLKGIETIIDLVTCRYIDTERLGYGPKKIHIQALLSDQEKSLDCTKTVLPLIDSGERFELTKEVYSLHRPFSTVYPQREIMVSYSLSWPVATLPPKNN